MRDTSYEPEGATSVLARMAKDSEVRRMDRLFAGCGMSAACVKFVLLMDVSAIYSVLRFEDAGYQPVEFSSALRQLRFGTVWIVVDGTEIVIGEVR